MDYRKVYGGTPAGTGSRCDTCAYAMIVKGYAESERITVCDLTYPAMRVPFPVAECSGYVNRTLPEFEQMEKIALDLTVARSPRHAGFKSARTAGNDEESVETRPAESRP